MTIYINMNDGDSDAMDNEHTSEGGRDDRGVPYHAESALSSAQVLKSHNGVRRASLCKVLSIASESPSFMLI